MKYLRKFNESIDGNNFNTDICKIIPNVVPNGITGKYFMTEIKMDNNDIIMINKIVSRIKKICKEYDKVERVINDPIKTAKWLPGIKTFYFIIPIRERGRGQSDKITLSISKHEDEYYICEIHNYNNTIFQRPGSNDLPIAQYYYLTFLCDQLEGLRAFGEGLINELKRIIS